ncbi:uncharacterized protein UDID_17182 [Ustilago sp. UG-2017a]|nr:uncharacterized protein UDID_17182 [Ustilago sp. UG-2017a]
MLASQDKQAKHGTLCGLPVARTGSIKGESSQATISSLAFDSICVTEVSSGRAVTSQRLTVVDSQVRSRGDQARMQEQRRSKGYICAMVYMRHGIAQKPLSPPEAEAMFTWRRLRCIAKPLSILQSAKRKYQSRSKEA